MGKILVLLPMAAVLAASAPADAKKDREKPAQSKQDPGQSKQDKDAKLDVPRQTEGHRPHDSNGDGVITRNEWPGNDKSFRDLDRNGDGVISKYDQSMKEKVRAPVHK